MRARPKMTYEQYKEAVRVYRILTNTPNLSALARQWGLAQTTVSLAVRRGVKKYDKRMADENPAA